MKDISSSPLYDSDLEAAAYICLAKAAMTDRDQFPPGLGDSICRQFHERRRRFEAALEKRMRGVDSILDLGLSTEDCMWAAGEAYRAIDRDGWELRFKTAAMRLKTLGTKP